MTKVSFSQVLKYKKRTLKQKERKRDMAIAHRCQCGAVCMESQIRDPKRTKDFVFNPEDGKYCCSVCIQRMQLKSETKTFRRQLEHLVSLKKYLIALREDLALLEWILQHPRFKWLWIKIY